MEMLIIIDLSVFLLLIVLANLSRRIGEALMIPGYYRILFYMAGIIAFASMVDIFIKGIENVGYIHTITLLVRAAAALISIPVCYKYWKWLLKENLKG